MRLQTKNRDTTTICILLLMLLLINLLALLLVVWIRILKQYGCHYHSWLTIQCYIILIVLRHHIAGPTVHTRHAGYNIAIHVSKKCTKCHHLADMPSAWTCVNIPNLTRFLSTTRIGSSYSTHCKCQLVLSSKLSSILSVCVTTAGWQLH